MESNKGLVMTMIMFIYYCYYELIMRVFQLSAAVGAIIQSFRVWKIRWDKSKTERKRERDLPKNV